MSQKRDKGKSQKGKPNSNTVDPVIAAEDVEKAIFPTNKPPGNAKPWKKIRAVLLAAFLAAFSLRKEVN